MTEIKLRAEECRENAADVRLSQALAGDTLDSLRTRLNSLSLSFTGATHDAFMVKLDEWKVANDQLLLALDGLGTFLSNAADTIENTDMMLAGQLTGA
ncbi:MAG TPA: WXG100 family type VII secretion target [Ilumatobacter sp.]|nr:WXG100 family type VII secretion target [Ilumatobacter sp.]